MVNPSTTIQESAFLTLEETQALIEAGNLLVISAEDALLVQLPKGNWIGGTIPYFYFSDRAGELSKSKLLVSDFTSYTSSFTIRTYEEYELFNLAENGYDNGFNFIILPALTEIHLRFAMEAPLMPDFFKNPTTGLVAGAALDEFAEKQYSRTFNGFLAESFTQKAVVLHAELPPEKVARVEIVNCFTQDTTHTIEVAEDTFVVGGCTIDGKPDNLVDFFERRNFDVNCPITCDYGGAIINVGIQKVDKERREVTLYAPMFESFEYHLSLPVENYPEVFKARIAEVLEREQQIVYNCNCIQNYTDGKLDENSIGFTGAATFGEIAYQLINQTFTYLAIDELG